MTRLAGISFFLCTAMASWAQGGSKEQRTQADALFAKGEYANAFTMYENLLGNNQEDFDLNYRYGVCALHAAGDKESAIAYLKRSTQGPSPDPRSWYWLGRAYQLTYRFKDALVAFERFRGTGDRKALTEFPLDALELQCRNGQNLLSNLKEIEVRNKVEVEGSEFFRFYDLSSIGGRIVVTPEELLSAADKKSQQRSLIYLPEKPGPIYFASYGKGGGTGRDIYRTELRANGEFATPVKLAGYINTNEDEDHPFMAPDGKSFYFCSKGHNSMGGYDVFKSTYDSGLDVFGPPQNMDFAVNTPDDEMLYLTDPEGKEACFASGRDSKQGKLHVYRVSTTQAPVNITVLKGTFASSFDENDRKAHVTVVDMLTQETVADVRTDIDGDYVLSLPRQGKYKFMVEAGPSGKVHVGVVEVPRNDEPKAYRQEMMLVDQGGEKLMIKNYFDAPLEEDMIALALDEIRRRARLDVGARPVVAEAPAELTPTGDVMTRAGFAGGVTRSQAQAMAKQDAEQLTANVGKLEERTKAAYSIAFDNTKEAETASQQAAASVAQAQAASDETTRNSLMTQAARERTRAQMANQRAAAAFQAGQDLDTERMAASAQALKAQKLYDDLTAALVADNSEGAVAKLTELKARMDVKNAPDGSITASERMRRAATEQERTAATLLQRAASSRTEENDLADRVARKQREENDAKGGKKQTLAQERTELQSQLAALHEETEQSFAKARTAQRATSIARGQAELARLLEEDALKGPVTELDKDRIAQLGQRIASTDQRNNALALDARFDAAVAEEIARSEARLFDWGTPVDDLADAGPGTTTTAVRSTEGDATSADGRTITMSTEAAGRDGLQPGVNTANMASVEGGGTDRTNAAQDTRSDAGNTNMASTNTTETNARTSSKGVEPAAGTNTNAGSTDVATAGDATGVPVTTAQQDGGSREDGRVVETPTAPVEPTVDPEERAFVLANQLAELTQLRKAERNKTERDSLDARIGQVKAEMQAAENATAAATDRDGRPATADGTEGTRTAVADPMTATNTTGTETAPEGASAGTRMTEDATTATALRASSPEEAAALVDSLSRRRPALEFPAAASEDVLLADIFPDYTKDRARIETNITDPQERGSGLHGLELMLVDSIEAEQARQADQLEQHPDRSATLLARMDRLRRMKESHLQLADAALAEAQQAYAAAETRRLEDEALAARTSDPSATDAGDHSDTPHSDSYISIIQQPEMIYSSPVDYRSEEVVSELKDLYGRTTELADLEDRIDSLESVIETLPEGRERERLRDRTDKMIDDHMIQRTDIGQSMGFYTRSEFKAAQDSAALVARAVQRMGLPVSDPSLRLAKELESEGKRSMDEATQLRKKADRSEDILLRDSLYRSAYGKELEAIRDLDRSITVQNYVLSDKFNKNERVAYVEVEQRMFGHAGPVADPVSASQEVPLGATVAGAPEETSAAAPTNTNGAPTANTSLNEAEIAAAAADAFERRSIEAADKASALFDQAAGAAKADRDRLEQQAMVQSHLSDSLHREALAAGVISGKLAEEREAAAQLEARKRRMMQFYYLNDEELALAMNEQDHSRYFAAKAKALEQRDQAARDTEESAATKNLADALLEQSRSILANSNAGGAALTPEQMAQAGRLTDQAVTLNARVDSLRRSSDRLRAAAITNDAQAASVLQSLEAQRATEIMALEQRTRRVEPVLAEARSMQGGDVATTANAQPATNNPNTVIGGTPEQTTAQPASTGSANEPVSQPNTTGSVPPVSTEVVPAGTSATTAAATPESRVETARAEPTPAPAGAPRLLAPLVSDEFSVSTAPVNRMAPIPVDAPMPAGVVFRVQIGAFKHPISDEMFQDLGPVSGESVGNGLVRYTAGNFTTAQGAVRATEQVRDRGYRDAFVVAYQDGKRVTLTQAMRATQGVQPATQPVVSASTERPVAEIRPVAPAVVVVPSDSAQAAERAVLANYPATAEELMARFTPSPEAADYYNVPGAAPARQVETVKGLFFTVQVGVYSKPTALDKLFNITPLNSERTETNKIRYTTGVFTDLERARTRKDGTVALGVKDAFITAYLNGKRIPMRDARALITKFGSAVFVDPAMVTR